MTETSSIADAAHLRRWLAQMLALIPTHREPACDVHELARRLREAAPHPPSPAEAEVIVRCWLTMLSVFDVFDPDERHGYRTRGQVASYFLRSLAWYVEKGLPLLGGWHTRGARNAPATNALLEHAPHFLRAMEQRRLQLAHAHAVAVPPSRRQAAVFILIKGVLAGERFYLHRYDADAAQFQLIGGRTEPGETPFAAARRELEEEVGPGAVLHPHPVLNPDAPIHITALSPTYGALTEYTFHLFTASLDGDALALTEPHRWLSVEAMLAGRTRAGSAMSDAQLARELDRRLPGGLRDAPLPTFDLAARPEHRTHLAV